MRIFTAPPPTTPNPITPMLIMSFIALYSSRTLTLTKTSPCWTSLAFWPGISDNHAGDLAGNRAEDFHCFDQADFRADFDGIADFDEIGRIGRGGPVEYAHQSCGDIHDVALELGLRGRRDFLIRFLRLVSCLNRLRHGSALHNDWSKRLRGVPLDRDGEIGILDGEFGEIMLLDQFHQFLDLRNIYLKVV